MIALNDNTLVVGQIKQLLHDFNLPNCSVGFKNPAANRHFIANGYINVWKEKIDDETGNITFDYEKICPYKYNKKYLNLTTNLPTRNLLYDRETHRYLGKYLRFIRDFRNVNLMSMYNCFDGDIFEGDVVVDRRIRYKDNINTSSSIRFKHNTNGFSVYSVPIDFQKLTIRISDGSMAYACLCIDTIDMNTSSKDAKLNQELMNATITKFHANEVINYDPAQSLSINMKSGANTSKFSISELLEFISKNIKNLKLLIRITTKTDIKITVLEGTYQINNTLTTKYFVIAPMEIDYVPILFPRYNDIASMEDANKSSSGLDSDGYPIDLNNASANGTFSEQANSVRFGLVKNRNSDSELYEILFIQRLIDPKDNDAFRNPINLVDSGFLIIPQLLQHNDIMNDQYLLADRMVEYLSGNVICPLSEDYDIRRMQLAYVKNGFDVFNKNVGNGKYIYGIWSPIDLYNTRKIISDNYQKIDNVFDMLGYVDKDVEKILGDKLDVI